MLPSHRLCAHFSCFPTPYSESRPHRGFTQLIELSELSDPAKGWVVDDALTLEALLLPFSDQPVRHYVTLSWTGEDVTDLRA